MSQPLRFNLHERPTAEKVRDVRDFIAAKQIKREPIKIAGAAVGSATWSPAGRGTFRSLMAGLRESVFADAAGHIDALARAVKRRSGIGLPVPRQVDQKPDGSLVLFWGPEGRGVTVMARSEGLASLIGGTKGLVCKGEALELLDALWAEARLQEARCQPRQSI